MKIAILGLGTVGGGVLRLLQNQPKTAHLEVAYIFAREIRHPSLDLTGIKVTNDLDEILNSDVELVVEVLGGVDVAYDIHRQCLARGKHVVTANKDMLALHLDELAALGNQYQAQIGYEASCGGGIPIIQVIEHHLAANTITRLLGILNGTTNYILTRMTQEHWTYQQALAMAQQLGYAEKDPTNDVAGLDTSRKMALLSRLAYHKTVDWHQMPIGGIDDVAYDDIEAAKLFGYTMKLVGQSEFDGEHVSMSVEPMLLSNSHVLAHVNGAKNAIFVAGDAVGETMFYGPGAGSLETASAVVADILFIERFGFTGNLVADTGAISTKASPKRAYYFRVEEALERVKTVLNELGVELTHWHEATLVSFLTQPMTAEQLDKIQQQLSVAAYYTVEGV
ncbi:homoserine dehydrogenase [Tuanshanicoccus lijuaniae]|uniref:homoserine dehydrogenase n=1 Tax=Aerococcaceae bacterium zg-1292 TaxID=2774330 RepID=UPI001BD87488|nr:homoserine dehydrogenase [Aerococcaceae bacterium zg-A91]MBS4457847.1 homoserine dehydrogenase [Aerococcaceae bacterium zg-BR33]